MSSFGARFALEITPFLATILVEALTSGFKLKFERQLDNISIEDIVEGSDIEDISNSALLSFHYEQALRYFDFSIVAVFIVFLTKAISPNANSEVTTVLGLLSICCVLALRVRSKRYFERRPPNKYGNIDRRFELFGLWSGVHVGTFYIIVANSIPIVCLILLELTAPGLASGESLNFLSNSTVLLTRQ